MIIFCEGYDPQRNIDYYEEKDYFPFPNVVHQDEGEE